MRFDFDANVELTKDGKLVLQDVPLREAAAQLAGRSARDIYRIKGASFEIGPDAFDDLLSQHRQMMTD